MTDAHSYFKGRNMMTPNIIRYGFVGKYAYELSGGIGISNNPIWGVTVVNRETRENMFDLSKCCFSLGEAEEHIRSLEDA